MSVSSCSGNKDDSEDESEEERTRFGGCYQGRLTNARDDSNKENIAPRRHLADATMIDQEEVALQEDLVAQRTREREAGPMSERSTSYPSRIPRRSSLSSSSNNGNSNGITLRSFQRTVSTPVNRKRLRGALDLADLEARAAAGDVDVRTPTTPLSRMRLDLDSHSARTNSHEDAESYFSSQATSIFDCMSTLDSQTSQSRCTTPDVDELDGISKQEQVITSVPTFANIYVHAKALLRYGAGTDSQVVGRERERSSLQRFLQKRFNLFAHLEHSASPDGECLDLEGAAESGSLYICGLPGTGKTALVRSILADLDQNNKTPKVAFVDCMSVQHPKEIFAKVLEALGHTFFDKDGEQDESEAEQRLSAIVKDPHQRTLIVLDEIDHLLRNRAHQNILYRLFSWGATSSPVQNDESGACALIGIANSLDLTERFVPLLASKGAAPAVLNFRPFEANEIMTVMRARLSQLYERYDGKECNESMELMEQVSNGLPLIESVALELASKKIAAATGDLRKALDACRLAIDAVESEEMSKIEKEEGKGPVCLAHLTMTKAAKVKPSHILKVLSAVLGSPQLIKIRALGLQSKLFLLALLVAQKRKATKLGLLGSDVSTASTSSTTTTEEMRIRDVECTYTAMLKNDDAGAFSTVESSELMDVIEGLEVEGVVQIISEVTSTGNRTRLSPGVGVSPSGKRAAKKQLLASNRAVALVMSTDEILRGISTASPLSSTIETSKVVVEAMNRIWNRECDRIERSKSWESLAQQSQKVREEELGGGRGAIGI